MTREEAIKYLIKPTITSTFIGEEKQKELNAYNMAIQALEQEPKTGHWIDEAEREPWYRCSECRERVWGSHHKYCPNCGARMVQESEDEE